MDTDAIVSSDGGKGATENNNEWNEARQVLRKYLQVQANIFLLTQILAFKIIIQIHYPKNGGSAFLRNLKCT